MRRTWCVAIPVVLFCALTGCACNETGMQSNYGIAYRTAVASQMLHPESARTLTPAAGMNAPEAGKVYEKYVKGFEKTAGQETNYIIPVGDQGGGFK